jgi:hypothetical protein
MYTRIHVHPKDGSVRAAAFAALAASKQMCVYLCVYVCVCACVISVECCSYQHEHLGFVQHCNTHDTGFATVNA